MSSPPDPGRPAEPSTAQRRLIGAPLHGPPTPPGLRVARARPAESGTTSPLRADSSSEVWPGVDPGQPVPPQPALSPPGPPRPEPDSRKRPRGGVPAWLFVLGVIGLVSIVGVLGFITPGYFVTTVFDHVAVQNGVRAVLRDQYRMPQVSEVVCPPDQRVLPARSFTCVATIEGQRYEVPIVIQDRAGHYRVGRPVGT